MMVQTKDPVCGMSVKPDSPHHYEYRGVEYHFCSAKCLSKFSATPEKYLYGNVSESGEIKDPVCGMTVKPDSKLSHEHEGKTYLFCSSKCQAKFAADPEKYLHPQPAKLQPAKPGVMYICPMDPEVRQDHPGACPKCGMALEPRGAATEDNAELRDMSRRFWISATLALPVFVIAMVTDLLPQAMPKSISMTMLQWIEFVLSNVRRCRASGSPGWCKQYRNNGKLSNRPAYSSMSLPICSPPRMVSTAVVIGLSISPAQPLYLVIHQPPSSSQDLVLETALLGRLQ